MIGAVDRAHVSDAYRALLVKGYVVLYFHRNGRVFVACVSHQRQDYARLV
jgi:plasmid stabilization system protein ParE